MIHIVPILVYVTRDLSNNALYIHCLFYIILKLIKRKSIWRSFIFYNRRYIIQCRKQTRIKLRCQLKLLP